MSSGVAASVPQAEDGLKPENVGARVPHLHEAAHRWPPASRVLRSAPRSASPAQNLSQSLPMCHPSLGELRAGETRLEEAGRERVSVRSTRPRPVVNSRIKSTFAQSQEQTGIPSRRAASSILWS
jgi:hypothetical protein